MFLTGQDHVVAHAEVGEHLKQLEGTTDAQAIEVAGAHTGHVTTIEAYATVGRLDLAENAIEQRRLSAAIGSDHAHHLSFLDAEGDAVHGG